MGEGITRDDAIAWLDRRCDRDVVLTVESTRSPLFTRESSGRLSQAVGQHGLYRVGADEFVAPPDSVATFRADWQTLDILELIDGHVRTTRLRCPLG